MKLAHTVKPRLCTNVKTSGLLTFKDDMTGVDVFDLAQRYRTTVDGVVPIWNYRRSFFERLAVEGIKPITSRPTEKTMMVENVSLWQGLEVISRFKAVDPLSSL